MQRINWHEAKEYLEKFNRDHGYRQGNSVCKETAHVGVVFTEDSFKEHYELEGRSYKVSSDNKAFLDGMIGYSIYAGSLDGTDPCVRLEQYMEEEYAGKGGWKVEYCYIVD